MKDRIEGWTQTDEDWTFGINGYDRCWKGAEPPSPEEQRVLLNIYRAVTKALREETIRWKVPPPTPDAIRAAIDNLLGDTAVPEGLAGAITIIK